MTLGVAALILVLSVMNGFRQELSERFLRILPHATIYTDSTSLVENLQSDGVILEWSPVLEDIAMASTSVGQALVSLTGIDTLREPGVVDIESILIEGDWAAFESQRFGILLGAQTARTLQVRAGDQMRLTLPSYRILPVGIYPRERNFEVMGIFSSSSQMDNEIALVRLQDAELLFQGVAARRGMRVRTGDPDNLSALTNSPSTTGVEIVNWQQRLHGLYEAMKLEKMVVGLMLVAVIFVAAFSLVASLMMSVAEKRTDIAVLRTMGAASSTILGVFLVQGLLFGGFGVILGAVIGTFLALFLSDIARFFENLLGASLFDPSIFYISFLPSQWHLADLIVIVAAALGIALLASILPAWHASRIAPAEAIHYNH